MPRALIVDDEIRAADALRLMLERFAPQVNHIAVCNDAREAAEMIRAFGPDLLFLDIKMPHLSGFDVLQQLPHKNLRVIFTTAFNEFAIKAIRFSAFDYLLKPLDVEELVACIERFENDQSFQGNNQELFQNITHNLSVPDRQFRLAVPSREGVHFLQPQQIMYCEARSNYTRIHTGDGKQFVASRTLGGYDDLLQPFGFIRCHKSFLVNRGFVAYISHEGLIVLKNGDSLEISKRRKAEVLRQLTGPGGLSK